MTTNYSAEQLAIIEEFKTGTGNVIIQARAGSGKTYMCEKGLPFAPEAKIGYTVFNKKNKIEAQERLKDPRVRVNTLNGLGYAFVKQQWQNAVPNDDIEWDRVDAVCGKKAPAAAKASVHKAVAFAKNCAPFAKPQDIEEIIICRGLELDQSLSQNGWDIDILVGKVMKILEMSKTRDPQGRVSFNDQLWLPVVMNWVRPWYNLMVVDEAQDLNETQIHMIKRSVKKGGRIFLIGDEAQCIYGFRGASIDTMARMKKDLNAKVLGLTMTFRCPVAVVEEAKRLVPDYRPAPGAEMGEVKRILDTKLAAMAEPGDFVLSRKNAPLTKVCLDFLKINKPARIEGRDIGANLISIINSLSASSVEILKIKIQKWADDKCAKLITKNGTEAAVDLIRDQAETIEFLAEDAKSVAELISKIQMLFTDGDGPRKAVVCSSCHKAKGLESDRVFLLTDTFTKDWEPVLCESINIKYTAITRAKKTLVWVDPSKDKTAA